MKVLHTIPRLKLSSGGPPLSTSLTVLGIRAKGIQADIATYQLESPKDKNIIEGDFIHFLPSPPEKIIAYSKYFRPFLKKHTDYDLYHCQGVWQYPSIITAKTARELKKPYVITPRGMLYPQEMKKNKLLKKVFWKLFLKKDLQHAACIHATCKEEMQHLRVMGITSPIAVIPNPIETQAIINKSDVNHTRIRIGYLGRVHPRKNIDRLIYAWGKLGSSVDHCELVIIGAGDEQYHNFLKKEVERLQLKNVVFTGFLIGEEKDKAISSLSYLAVPSDFENFGMIIAEALAYQIPVIASKGTPWEELNTYYCGWWVDNDVKTLENTIRQAINLPEEERRKMGKNGSLLIKNHYSVDIISTKIVQLYSWIVKDGEKPDFVYLYNSLHS